MQEKDIRKKLNQELEEMTPDILNKILSSPIEPVKSEKELFGKNKPLYKEKKNVRQYLIAPVMVAVAACLFAVIILLQPFFVENKDTKMAFSIIVDVNPSISVEVNADGSVDRVVANNKDAKKIVREINGEIKEEYDYNDAMGVVVKSLKKSGYLKKKTNAMLVSTVGKNGDVPKDTLKELKVETKKIMENSKINSKTVFQNCEVSRKVKKVAKKNNVSIGKAALCIKLADKESTSVNKMCEKSIDKLVAKVEKNKGIFSDDVIVYDDELEDTGSFVETISETVTAEMESVTGETMESESESVSEETGIDTTQETNIGENDTTMEQTLPSFP